MANQNYNEILESDWYIDRPDLSINRMYLDSARHTCVFGQYASFARAVEGQLHLNGFLFSCISTDKTNGTVVFISLNT